MVRFVVVATCVLGIAGCTFDTSATGNARDGSVPTLVDAKISSVDAGEFDASAPGQDGGVPSMAYTRTIDISPPVMTEELDGFVVAILIEEDTRLKDHARTDGADIAFKTTAGAELPHEIEAYDGSSGSLVAWVRLSSLPISGTSIVMYYGGGGPFASPNATATWATTFAAVWHFSDDNIEPGIYPDSTGGGSTTAIAPSGSAPTSAAGIAGAGLLYDGVTDSLIVPNSADGPLNFATTSFSFATWVFVSEHAGMWDAPLHKGGSDPSAPGYAFELGSGSWHTKLTSPSSVSTTILGDQSNFVGQWVHLVATLDRTDSTLRSYTNGIRTGATVSIPNGVSLSGSELFKIGRHDLVNGGEFKGRLDEVRVYNVVLSEDWIAAEHANLNDPESFLDIGPENLLGN